MSGRSLVIAVFVWGLSFAGGWMVGSAVSKGALKLLDGWLARREARRRS